MRNRFQQQGKVLYVRHKGILKESARQEDGVGSLKLLLHLKPTKLPKGPLHGEIKSVISCVLHQEKRTHARV